MPEGKEVTSIPIDENVVIDLKTDAIPSEKVMMHAVLRILRCIVLMIALFANTCQTFAQPEARKKQTQKDEISALIDKLQEIKDGDTGYIPTMTGGGFLPLGTSQPGMMLLFQKPPARSGVMLELVKHGAAAVPLLIAHLDDKRATKITIEHDGFIGGLYFFDEYDFNGRTSKKKPEGVNREEWSKNETPNKHTITVGDLCFVALGQIVNRHFNATRYQPTACIMVNSPTYSKALLKTIRKEWGDITPERHKQSLVRDFTEPDFEGRRLGACLRIGYYYPEVLEPLALKQLAEPLYDRSEMEKLILEKLYRSKDAKERKELFDAFVAKRGEVARQGIQINLFEHLERQQYDEEGRVFPPLNPKYAARACLVELYGYPKEVKSKDRPFLLPVENCMQADFIDALTFFPTVKADQAVRQILHSTEEDYLACACVKYLIGRGVADADIRRYVEQRLKGADEERRKQLQSMLARLGWKPLHVAAEGDDEARLAKLIGQGADIYARAANGQTPLHVAASCGSYGAIRLLLEMKADPNLKDKQGQTPVQLAMGHESAVEILLAGGAEIPDILVASFAGRDDLVMAFLAKDKTAVRSKTGSDQTPLHLATQRGHVKVAVVLLEHGADVNAASGTYKFTPLHDAVLKAQKEMVALLLSHKADRNAKNSNGKTPLDLAREWKEKDIARLLEVIQ